MRNKNHLLTLATATAISIFSSILPHSASSNELPHLDSSYHETASIINNIFPSPENVATETLMIGLYQEGIRRGIEYNIISTSAVGISDTSLGPGTIGIPDDFVDRVNYSPSFEIDGFKPDYVSMHPSFDPKLREIMLQAAEIENVRVVNGGIYVRRLKGRRYETAEEVEEEMMLHPNKLLYFGMTSPEEDIAANALGMKYATIVFATNNGAGLDAPISHENVAKEFEKALPRGIRIINRASELLH